MWYGKPKRSQARCQIKRERKQFVQNSDRHHVPSDDDHANKNTNAKCSFSHTETQQENPLKISLPTVMLDWAIPFHSLKEVYKPITALLSPTLSFKRLVGSKTQLVTIPGLYTLLQEQPLHVHPNWLSFGPFCSFHSSFHPPPEHLPPGFHRRSCQKLARLLPAGLRSSLCLKPWMHSGTSPYQNTCYSVLHLGDYFINIFQFQGLIPIRLSANKNRREVGIPGSHRLIHDSR